MESYEASKFNKQELYALRSVTKQNVEETR